MTTDHQTWMSFSNDQVELLRQLLNKHHEAAPLIGVLDNFTAPEAKDQWFRNRAEGLRFVSDGQCEIDDCAVVSASDDGAYVMAWVWVEGDEDAEV